MNTFKEEFIWTNKDGKKILLSEMETSYLFNCMKMLYNCLAYEFGYKIIGDFNYSTHEYFLTEEHGFSVFSILWKIKVLTNEIETRKNLPNNYHKDYFKMLYNLPIGINNKSYYEQ